MNAHCRNVKVSRTRTSRASRGSSCCTPSSSYGCSGRADASGSSSRLATSSDFDTARSTSIISHQRPGKNDL
jgi:hypothetical protein